MDQIIIEDLEVFGYHGVFREENENGQSFFINAVLDIDTRPAGLKDDLSLSTNYASVCEVIHEIVSKRVYKLIETVAEEIAEKVLLEFPLVKAITVEVRKPEAPIIYPFKSVSVKIRRSWHQACIALGSNMGDSKQLILDAIEKLKEDKHCKVNKVSDLIVTAPYGGVEQDDFINGALSLQTLYTPYELLNVMQQIEKDAGREREVHWGPRTLDLDLVLYDDLILEEDDLIIPHKDMLNRDFVMKPLAQVAPGMIHPIAKKTVRVLAEEMETKYIK